MKASFFVALVALLPFAFAEPAQSEEMVQTPGGLRPKSSVMQIPEGGLIKLTDNEVHLLDANNKIVHVAPRGKGAKANVPSVTKREQTGWISWAIWQRPSAPINNFVTTWTVPANPPANHGQLLYLFNALVPTGSGAILQPVLQWGVSPAGGGQYWAVSNWYVSDSSTYWSTLQRVNVGQSLQGVLRLTGQSGSSFNYTSSFTGIAGVTTLVNSRELTDAYETLEAYGVTAASDYPTGCTAFSGIGITTTSGTPSVSWSTVNDTADGITTTVNINGATNGKVTICYPSH